MGRVAGRSAILTTVAAVLASGILLGLPPAQGSLAPSASSVTSVAFDLNLPTTGALGVSLGLTGNLSLSGGEISPGQTLNATATLALPSSVELTLDYNGATSSVPVAPVGSSLEIPVPGLGITYLGVALGVFLNFSSEVTATSTVSGSGTGGGGNLSWSATGTQQFSIRANDSAAPGSTVVSVVSNLEYSVSLGVDVRAAVPILGNYTAHLLPFGHLGLVAGRPASVQGVYTVPTPSSLAGDLTRGATPYLLGAAVAGGVAIASLVLLRRRRRRQSVP